MLSYAAHLPHSPLLLKQISGTHASVFKKTNAAILSIADDLYARRINTVLTITPHGDGFNNAFLLNFSPVFSVNLELFGDFETTGEFRGDELLSTSIRDRAASSAHPIVFSTHPTLDLASSVALLKMREHNAFAPRVVSVTHSLLPTNAHIEFGKTLRDAIEQSDRRIAVISLGDLSRTSERRAKEASLLDHTILDDLRRPKSNLLVLRNHTSDKRIKSFNVAAMMPLLIHAGILDEMQSPIEVISYEHKLGVGMMVARLF